MATDNTVNISRHTYGNCYEWQHEFNWFGPVTATKRESTIWQYLVYRHCDTCSRKRGHFFVLYTAIDYFLCLIPHTFLCIAFHSLLTYSHRNKHSSI